MWIASTSRVIKKRALFLFSSRKCRISRFVSRIFAQPFQFFYENTSFAEMLVKFEPHIGLICLTPHFLALESIFYIKWFLKSFAIVRPHANRAVESGYRGYRRYGEANSSKGKKCPWGEIFLLTIPGCRDILTSSPHQGKQ